MQTLCRTALVAALSLSVIACAKKAEQASTDLNSEQQKFSYSIGANFGRQLEPAKGELDVKALEKGLEDSLAGAPLKLDDKAREEVVRTVAQRIQQKQVAERQKAGEKNQAEGEKFLADNKQKPDVKTTASGLEYTVIEEGHGASPTAQDTVTVNYKGTLLDGSTFDSSYDRGQPATFALSNVIPGWTEGLQLMKTGGKYKFFVPAALAYGERGPSPQIGPNSVLIFEVELISVQKR